MRSLSKMASRMSCVTNNTVQAIDYARGLDAPFRTYSTVSGFVTGVLSANACSQHLITTLDLISGCPHKGPRQSDGGFDGDESEGNRSQAKGRVIFIPRAGLV